MELCGLLWELEQTQLHIHTMELIGLVLETLFFLHGEKELLGMEHYLLQLVKEQIH